MPLGGSRGTGGTDKSSS